ncbi:MAG: hypothetical protein GX410_01295 [Elusimicrobia bacterium]|nr:hypothetical protein [Elusimicrobiota bacterium]
MKAAVEKLVYPGFWFGKTDPADALALAKRGVGGFCLYGGSAREVLQFTSWLRAESGRELVFCADYEDGVGQWVPEGTLLPSNMAIGASASPALAARKAEITAKEASALGVDWIFAPVVDLATNPDNPIVNTRAFGASPELVCELGAAYLYGLRQQGAFSCLKHFPGHGSAAVDSHLALPVIEAFRSELEKGDLVPYKKLSAQADGVMVGHLMATALDPKLPASSSVKIMNTLLRRGIGHHGRIVTDALLMGAVADWRQTVLLAVMAGADTLLAPENPFELCDFLCALLETGAVPAAVINSALERHETMLRDADLGRPRPDISVLGCQEHRQAVVEMSASCMAWQKRPLSIPLRRDDSVYYVEPGVTSPDKWEGKVFVESLKEMGIRIDNSKPSADKLLVASFSRPRAFSGSINIDPRQLEQLRHMSRERKSAVAVAFGSPFIFSGLGFELEAGLCAFSHCAEFQRAAAKVLCGYVEPSGSMPVNA